MIQSWNTLIYKNKPHKAIDASRKGGQGTYRLAELDGTELERFYVGDRVKNFVRGSRYS